MMMKLNKKLISMNTTKVPFLDGAWKKRIPAGRLSYPTDYFDVLASDDDNPVSIEEEEDYC